MRDLRSAHLAQAFHSEATAMYGIRMTEGFTGKSVLNMCSHGTFCFYAVPAGRIGITQPWDRTTATDDRLRNGTGTYADYLGVGPQVAVGMPAGA
jgi:hypothetical protein